MNLGNKELKLKYTYNALAEYEARYGRSLITDISARGFLPVRRLIFAGLLHYNDPALTEKAVGDLIQQEIETGGKDLMDFRDAISEAMEDAVFIQRLAEKSRERQTASLESSGTRSES